MSLTPPFLNYVTIRFKTIKKKFDGKSKIQVLIIFYKLFDEMLKPEVWDNPLVLAEYSSYQTEIYMAAPHAFNLETDYILSNEIMYDRHHLGMFNLMILFKYLIFFREIIGVFAGKAAKLIKSIDEQPREKT